MIRCFSNVTGHKNAQELVIDLNQTKSDMSEPFYIQYDKTKDYIIDDNYIVIGNVTEQDWNDLNLERDFVNE
jgi:hypothetical protein